MYFYFDSEQAAATALVSVLYQELTAPTAWADTALSTEELIDTALSDWTMRLWREHAVVMRFASQHGNDIPEIAALWEDAMKTWTDATVAIMQRDPNGMADRRDA